MPTWQGYGEKRSPRRLIAICVGLALTSTAVILGNNFPHVGLTPGKSVHDITRELKVEGTPATIEEIFDKK